MQTLTSAMENTRSEGSGRLSMLPALAYETTQNKQTNKPAHNKETNHFFTEQNQQRQQQQHQHKSKQEEEAMALNPNQFTDKVNELLQESKNVAIENSNPQVCL